MPQPPSLPPLRDVIRDHGLSARKALGQHFLLDTNLMARVARSAGALEGRTVIEVGPGPGGLTRALLDEGAEKVIAIEKDSRCIAALEELANARPGRLEIVEADATRISLSDLGRAPRKVVANLPYNVSTVILLNCLRDLRAGLGGPAPAFERLTLMFQKEVADRLAAPPRNKTYGRLSVMTQWLMETKTLFNIGKEAFTPPPKVVSTVVDMVPREEVQPAVSWTAMEAVTAAAFGQRRKMLRGSLKGLMLDPAAAGLDPTARAEDLSVDAFGALARLYEAQKREG